MRTARMAAGAMVVGLALAGCGAGQTASTAYQLPSVPGVSAGEGGIAVRNAAVPFAAEGYERGGTAPVGLSMFNDTSKPVTLSNVTSPDAGSVEVPGDDRRIPEYGSVSTTLELAGLTTDALVDPTGRVSLVLTFSNGVELLMEVPVAPPPDRTGDRTIIDGVGH